jgi:hypothetical protein
MASSIDASTSGAGGVITTADNTGILQLKTAGVVAVTVNASSALGVGTSPSFGTSGQVLTSAGSSAAPTWSTISSGGMTLLGTLTTTSGTSQTLSGLTLTGYKYLQISINNVSGNAVGFLRMAGLNIQPYSSTAAQSQWGTIQIDLTNSGAFGSIIVYDQNTTSGTVRSDSYAGGGNCGYTTATTSISFDYSSAATFDSGTIKVYGVS